MRKITKQKYYAFITALYDAKEFDIKQMMREHQVSTRITTLLREQRLIARYGKITKWVGDIPTQAMANALAKESSKIARISKMQSKSTPSQLIIKPIKAINSVAQQPVKIDSTHTPYPLMDIVIAFFSGMVAAGFIQLIWK